MNPSIDHDHLFKELLSTFFVEFLQLFVPEILTYLDPTSLVALDKELFDVSNEREAYETDILMRGNYQKEQTFFLIHLEHQSYSQSNFAKRMYRYFARLYEKYDVPVYPIVIFSYDRPLRPEPSAFEITFPNKEILKFNYEVIQLNQLDWHNFVSRPNPVASALMAKMNIAPEDRPRVKLECLKMLVGLDLNPSQAHFISGFVDTYLRLNEVEEQIFDTEIAQLLPAESKEEVMQIVTSWMEEGIRRGRVEGRQEGRQEGRLEGRQEGRQEGQVDFALKLLSYKFGLLSPTTQDRIQNLTSSQLESLGEASFDFTNQADILLWLDRQQAF